MISTPRSRRSRLIRLAVLGLAVTPLACSTTGINRGDFNLISIEDEWALGDKLAADVAKQVRLLDSPGIQGYVTRMGQTILTQARDDTPVAQQPWSFHVIDDQQVNAFNIPGGHVYIHAGLVAHTNDYSELMSVVAHETAHGLARHAVENISKTYGLSVVAGILLGNNPAVYQEILANVLAGGAVLKFSRDAEREADKLGLQYMYDAGIDPRGMIDMFRILLELRQSQPGALERLLSDHPLTEERIQNAQDQIAKLPQRSLTRNDAGFAAFKRAVASAATASR